MQNRNEIPSSVGPDPQFCRSRFHTIAILDHWRTVIWDLVPIRATWLISDHALANHDSHNDTEACVSSHFNLIIGKDAQTENNTLMLSN